jgi:hypothetical protein
LDRVAAGGQHAEWEASHDRTEQEQTTSDLAESHDPEHRARNGEGRTPIDEETDQMRGGGDDGRLLEEERHLQASNRSGPQELGWGGLRRYGDGPGWWEHGGMDDGGEGAARDGEHNERAAPSELIDEVPTEGREHRAGQSSGHRHDREGSMAAGRVERDQHGHRGLVQRGCHGQSDDRPGCEQRGDVLGVREADHAECPDDRPSGEYDPGVPPCKPFRDRRGGQPGDEQTEGERCGDH